MSSAAIDRRNNNRFFYLINLFSEMGWWAINLNPIFRAKWMKDAIDPRRREICFPDRLLPYINTIRNNGGIPRVIDVGSGPLTPLAWGIDNDLIDLVAVDPLASTYRFLMKIYMIEFPVKPLRAFAEDLQDNFDTESFDIVYSRNALDHVRDAELCIRNVARLLKTGGIFHFQGFANEGSKQGWRGLHKHDYVIDNGNLIWSNQYGETSNLSDIAGLKCIYQNKQRYATGEWFIAEFTKK